MLGGGAALMAHTTTCPSCGTTFRVTAEQLLARNGNVRCGRCSHVFNAHESLSLDYPQPESEAPVEEPQPDAAETDEIQEFAVEAEMLPEAEPPPEQAPEPEFLAVDLEAEVTAEPEPKPAVKAEAEPESQPDGEINAEILPEEPATEPSPELPPEPPPEAEPESLPPVETVLDGETAAAMPDEATLPPPEEAPAAEVLPRRRSLRLMWLVGIVLLALALLLQNILHFRNELIAQSPGLKPIFEQACGVFGCRVALPQNADLLSIEASSLETSPTLPGIVMLNAALRNRAGYTQAYPLFELTLTDYQDKLVARRVFHPQEYLPPAAATQAGMPANEEVEVKLNIDLGDAKAAGYRIYLFYSATAN